MLVLAISGSLRAGSYNTRLLRAAARGLPPEAEFRELTGLDRIPPYNQDLDLGLGPVPVRELRQALRRADAVLISTPEYNHSIPGQLKNALDWASRPFTANSVRGRPVAVVCEFDGALEIGEDLADARAYGRVDAASVDTNLARRDEHLRSTDFLSAESHPELTFRSKAIEPVEEDTFRVIGDLSINGVTNEVGLIAELGGIETGPEGEERLGLEVTGQLSRTAFAMKFLAALGRAVVADKVKIVIDVAAVKKA